MVPRAVWRCHSHFQGQPGPDDAAPRDLQMQPDPWKCLSAGPCVRLVIFWVDTRSISQDALAEENDWQLRARC